MSIKRLNNSIKGESLIEVTAAVAIISIVMVGVISLASYTLRFTTQARTKNIASALAKEAVEVARNNKRGCYSLPMGFSNVSATGDALVISGGVPQDLGTINPELSGYFRTIRIQDISAAPTGTQVANNGKVPPGKESKNMLITVTVTNNNSDEDIVYYAILSKGL